jgi:periplasmic protein CpxP/Spy
MRLMEVIMQGTKRKERLGRLIFPLALAVLLGLVPALGFAKPADPPPGPMGPGGPDPEMMLDRLTEKLDLSDQQRQDLAGIFASHKEAMRATFAKMKDARDALDQAIHADTFDETAIRDASAAVAAVEANGAVERGKLFQQVKGILTPEQLQKFEEMRQNRKERMHDRHGRGGPHGPGRGPQF